MKVCVVGAGNIGLVCAGVMASRQSADEVVVLSSGSFDAEKLVLEDHEKGTRSGNLGVRVSCDHKMALGGADYIFCTYPAFLRKSFVEQCGAYIKEGSKLGFIPGYGGAEYSCDGLVSRGVTVFGLQRVPFVARQSERRVASLLSRKNMLYVASIPKSKVGAICADLEHLLGIPARPLAHYLAVTLAPSNPLLHLTGLYNVFHARDVSVGFDRQLMFYEEWTDEASELLFAYDAELQEICTRLPFDLHEVVPLPVYYESFSPADMTKKLKSIEAFKVVKVPMKKSGESYFPDFGSRMFVEDFPCGIAIIKEFALLTGTETPAIDKILRFYADMTGIEYFDMGGSPSKDIKDAGVPSNFGLNSVEDIAAFYDL